MATAAPPIRTESPAGTLSNARNRRLCLTVVVLVSLIYFIGLAEYARVRPIDGDEGFYTTAARLVWEGKAPYRDFAYQQAPLLPYLYSWIWAVYPRSLIAMRVFSAFCGSLTALLWGLALLRAGRLPPKVALLTFLVFILNPTLFSWNVVVKTYAAANLLITVASIALYAAVRSDKIRWYFGAALALGVAACVRSLYGPLIPAVLIWCLRTEWRRSSCCKRSCAFLVGSLVGTLPIIWSFARNPRAFLFNNIVYHHLETGFWLVANGRYIEGYRSPGHVAIIYSVQLVIVLLLLHPYFSGTVALAIAGGTSLLKMKRTRQGPYSERDYLFLGSVCVMSVLYIFVALTPFPPIEQYFSNPLPPLMVPFVGEGIRVCSQSIRKTLGVVLIAPLFLWIESGRENYLFSREAQWTMRSYVEITRIVEANTSPNDVVLSFYPGYVFETGRIYFPGLENQWGFLVMNKVTPEERSRFRVLWKGDVLDAVSHRKPQLVVIDLWISVYYQNLSVVEVAEFRQALAANYSLLETIDGVQVYERNSITSANDRSNRDPFHS